jgi:hypothetical protein
MNHSRRLSFLFGSFAALLVGSCECQRAESQARAYAARTGPAIYATDLVELEDIRDFYKRVFGVDAYTTAWSELDKFRSGTVATIRIPYQDTWYPERTGGTNVPVGANSALAKYDAAFNGGQNKAVQWERDNHNRPTPNWYGHCNGTGVTVTRFQNPVRNVTRPRGCTAGTAGCVEFTPADIRALLSEMNMNAKAKFISGNRCRATFEQIRARPVQRANPQVMDECDDVNPGSFHAALVNFIGRQKQPLVFDEHQDEEVWNYPIYSYDYTAEGPLPMDQAIAALRNSIRDPNNTAVSAFPPMDSWIFNPRAVSFMRINLNIAYREATFDNTGAGTKPAPRTASYEYILELDANNNVIGGEWMGPSRTYHPDFVWMPFEPADPTGDDSRGNAFLSNTEVVKLWADSVGFNPDDPFHDKPKNAYDVRFFPPSDLVWGTVRGYFRLLLDGRTTGTAFLGKKTHLRVETQDILKGDSTVEVSLNGQPLPSGNFQDGRMDILFDAPPGINLLTLRWTSGRVDTSELNWDFRFYAM